MHWLNERIKLTKSSGLKDFKVKPNRNLISFSIFNFHRNLTHAPILLEIDRFSLNWPLRCTEMSHFANSAHKITFITHCHWLRTYQRNAWEAFRHLFNRFLHQSYKYGSNFNELRKSFYEPVAFVDNFNQSKTEERKRQRSKLRLWLDFQF